MARLLARPLELAQDHEKAALWAVALFPLLAVALIVIFKLMPRVYMFLIQEDGLVEWATAVVYLIASFLAASLVYHFWREKENLYALLYVGLALGMFFIAMEEISWGQRQLNFESPDLLRGMNYKQEFNAHNISGFPLHEAFIVVGFYGAFSRLIASAFWSKPYPKFIELLTPPYALSLYFFIPFAFYVYNEYLYYTELLPKGLEWSEYWTDEHFIIGKDQEPLELLLSLGFLLFVLLIWARYRVGAPLSLAGSPGAKSQPQYRL